MTHQKILAMLHGCSAQKPMPFNTLVDKSGLLPETLRNVLESMQYSIPAPINCAKIADKYGIREVYWPTGVKGPFLNPRQLNQQEFRRAQQTRIQPESAATTKPIGETIMANQPVTIKDILDIVVAKPGIKRSDVMQRLIFSDGSNRKSIEKFITNAIGRNALKQTEADGVKLLHPVKKTNEGIARAVKKADRKAEIADAPAPIPASDITKFTMMLSDENYLHIGFGDEMFTLNPEQLARLDRFMARVFPDGVPLPDGKLA